MIYRKYRVLRLINFSIKMWYESILFGTLLNCYICLLKNSVSLSWRPFFCFMKPKPVNLTSEVQGQAALWDKLTNFRIFALKFWEYLSENFQVRTGVGNIFAKKNRCGAGPTGGWACCSCYSCYSCYSCWGEQQLPTSPVHRRLASSRIQTSATNIG
jgi:hypothetical protein